VLIIVLIVVILVLLPIILAAALYAMVSGLIGGPSPTTKPAVTLVLSSNTASGADILVAGAQPAASPTNFKVNLQVGYNVGVAQAIALPEGSQAAIFVGNATYLVAWINPGGSGQVSQGDHFVVTYPTGPGAPSSGTQVTFFLLWSDGSLTSQVSFTVYIPQPVIALTLSSSSATGADILVAGAQPAYPYTRFWVNLENVTGFVSGTPEPVAPAGIPAFVSLEGNTYNVTWVNPSGTGQIVPGDHFLVEYPSGAAPAAGITLAFSLVWDDGSTLATLTWQV